MRTRSLIAAVIILAGLPVLAEDMHQSYITYDDSDSVLVQDDGREVDARVNLPVYPGDEVRAARRGRTELRLADGNIIALDRDSVVRFRSMLLNFEEGADQTVAELVSGHVMLYRRYRGSEPLRLDSSNASYVSERESIYGVETNSRGIDVATVFEGSVEVRTPNGSTQLRAGDRAKIDVTGVYDRRSISKVAATEFERWFLQRGERYANRDSRHLDASLAYAEDDLDEHGRWVYVKDYDSWAWSPYVSTGWRPYNYGYWGWGANGACWISYEPWGWVPYHYGRWTYVAHHGWIWLPGYVYSPAWVYWAWGPSWVGWVPWGYYSYYPGYYGWLNDPYCNPRIYGQYGFRGNISVSSGDLSAYTIVDSRTLFSDRVDRAALTADAVRDRLAREGGRAVFTNQPTRMNRSDMRDPSTAVDRIIRGSRDGSGTGSVGAGSSGDLTQFFRRDPALPQTIRDRVTQGQRGTRGTTATTPGRNTMPSSPLGAASTAGATVPGRGGVRGSGGGTGGMIDRPGSGGGQATPPATGGTLPRGGSGSTLPRGGGATTGGSSGSNEGTSDRPVTNRPGRGTTPRTQEPDTPRETSPRGGTDTPPVDRSGSGGNTSSTGSDWRSRPVRGAAPSGSPAGGTTTSPRQTTRGGDDDPVSRPATPATPPASTSTRGSSDNSWRGAGETVRRVIGSIGGARLTPSDNRGSSSSSGDKSGSRSSTRGSGSSGSTSASSNRGGGSGSVSRPSSGSSSSGSSSSSGGSKGSSGSSSSSSSPRSSGGGGKVDRGG